MKIIKNIIVQIADISNAWRSSLYLFLALSVPAFVNAQNATDVTSVIEHVTVYKKQAIVSRVAQMDLPKGKSTVVLKNLPAGLLNESVRIKTLGGVRILDTKIETVFSADTIKNNKGELETRADSLKKVISEAINRSLVYETKAKLAESLKNQCMTFQNQKLLINPSAVQEFEEILSYVEKELAAAVVGKSRQRRIREKAEESLAQILQIIESWKGVKPEIRSYKNLLLTLELNKGGHVKIMPSYLISGAGWTPQYDFRVNSANKSVEVGYYASVSQNTGEDWKNAELSLSTSNPQTAAAAPVIENFYISDYPVDNSNNAASLQEGASDPEFSVNYSRNAGLPDNQTEVIGMVVDLQTGAKLPGVTAVIEGTKYNAVTDDNGNFRILAVLSGRHSIAFALSGYHNCRRTIQLSDKSTVTITAGLNAMDPDFEKQISIRAAKMFEEKATNTIKVIDASGISGVGYENEDPEIVYTNSSAKELSTVFSVPGLTTVDGNSKKHKVTIAINKMQASFDFASVPRLDPTVFMKGKIVNTNSYPFLPGSANIFVDDDFVNTDVTGLIVPSDTMKLTLGPDKQFKISRKLIKKTIKPAGAFSGNNTTIYEYSITIVNLHSTEESINVLDNFPVSHNQQIEVKLLEPLREAAPADRLNKLEWNITLKPGETKVIPIQFEVTSPSKMLVYGLD